MEKKWVKMPEVLFFQEGPGVRNTQYTSSGVKLLNVANLVDGRVDLSTSDRYISEEEAYGKYSHFLCDAGDFIVASSGIKVEYVDKKMGFIEESMLPLCMNTSTIRFKALDPSRLLIRYFMYYMKSFHFKEQLSRFITGSAQLNYGPSHLNKMVMPLVPIIMQKKVITQLDEAQTLIALCKQQLTKLDDLTKARFVEMFGDPEANPMKWGYIQLGEICDLQNGYAFKSDDYLDHSTVLNCRMSNIRPDGGFDADYHPKYLPDEYWDTYQSYRLVDGDVIIAMTDMASDPKILGVPTIVKSNGHKFLLNQRVGKLLFRDTGRMNNTYIMFFLGQAYIRKSLAKAAGGSTQINVGKPAILSITILEPPLQLQDDFAHFVSQVDKSKIAVQKALDEAQLLFDSLMQKYFG